MKKVFGMTMVIALAMVLGSFTPAQAAPAKAGKKVNNVQQHAQIININTASVDQLVTLKGIGQKMFDKMRKFITVK